MALTWEEVVDGRDIQSLTLQLPPVTLCQCFSTGGSLCLASVVSVCFWNKSGKY